MERRAKERLIGAGILVALAVIVVPELLSGPKPEAARPDAPVLPRPAGASGPVRNVTVDLTTSKPLVPAVQAAAPPPAPPTPAATATAVPSTPGSTPAGKPDESGAASGGAPPSGVPPGGSPPGGLPPSPNPGVVTTTPALQAPSLESAASPPRSAATFAVQLGSFANRSNADNLVRQLKAQGYAVYMSGEGSGKAVRYRVRVGPLNDRDAAERTIAKLKLAGHAATLLAPR